MGKYNKTRNNESDSVSDYFHDDPCSLYGHCQLGRRANGGKTTSRRGQRLLGCGRSSASTFGLLELKISTNTLMTGCVSLHNIEHISYCTFNICYFDFDR